MLPTKGRRLARARLAEGVEGVARFHELVASHAENPDQVVIGIETDRGLFVGALVAAGYQVYGINPLSVSRYRDRHTPLVPSPTPATPRCFPTWCAPTVITTAWWRATVSKERH